MSVVKRSVLIYMILVALMALGRKDVMPMDFTQFKWKNRLLFLFAPDRNQSHFIRLHAEIIDQKAEVEDRDLVVFEILEHGTSRMNTTELDRQSVDSIRNRFAVSENAFTLVLVGKDGGIKLKRNDQIDLKDIFGLIDAMPMRQNEMRRKD